MLQFVQTGELIHLYTRDKKNEIKGPYNRKREVPTYSTVQRHKVKGCVREKKEKNILKNITR